MLYVVCCIALNCIVLSCILYDSLFSNFACSVLLAVFLTVWLDFTSCDYFAIYIVFYVFYIHRLSCIYNLHSIFFYVYIYIHVPAGCMTLLNGTAV